MGGTNLEGGKMTFTSLPPDACWILGSIRIIWKNLLTCRFLGVAVTDSDLNRSEVTPAMPVFHQTPLGIILGP